MSYSVSWRRRRTYKEGFGRSPRSFTSKIHARAEDQGHPFGIEVTGGEVSDYSGFEVLMSLPVATSYLLLADKVA
ncbi:hypothetical protein [Zymomonas mobilis]|uniref:hypothetical protein n=1 Tax=Zymomonas mobilis TaxID=542 RepID=UPI0020FFF7E2|nr:hypothetical protein [Zymomonas mobilis]